MLYVYVWPTIKGSIEDYSKKNELSEFFVSVANPVGGVAILVEVRVPMVVLGQKLGVIVHYGILNEVKFPR